MTFEDPTSGDQFKTAEHNGELVVVQPSCIEQITTSMGEGTAARAKVTVIDGQHAGEVYDDALMFGKVIVSSLKGMEGRTVLGRIGQGEARPGQSAPWILHPATDAEKQTAAKALERINAAATQPSSPAPATSGQPPF